MSNPITLLSDFNGSLAYTVPSGGGSWTGVDPIRYSGGLQLEEGATNLSSNPSIEVDASNYTQVSATLSSSTDMAVVGSRSLKAAVSGAGGNRGWLSQSFTVVQGDVMSARLSVRSDDLTNMIVALQERDTAFSVLATVTVDNTNPTSGQWREIVFTRTIANATATRFYLNVTSSAAGSIYADKIAVFKSPYALSYFDGSMGSGYAWTGTTHASTSTRAASSAAISPSGILVPSSGALAFRITPTIETGVEEIWGECGVKGSGTDHVRWGRDSSKHPFVEWSANNASYQRLTGSETLNALTAYDLYLGHSATTISLAVDAGTLQTGTRDAVSDSWGAGNLTLEATKGGVVYNQFATFNRPLSASEIKTLDRRISWSRTMFGNLFAYFQLRPY